MNSSIRDAYTGVRPSMSTSMRDGGPFFPQYNGPCMSLNSSMHTGANPFLRPNTDSAVSFSDTVRNGGNPFQQLSTGTDPSADRSWQRNGHNSTTTCVTPNSGDLPVSHDVGIAANHPVPY